MKKIILLAMITVLSFANTPRGIENLISNLSQRMDENMEKQNKINEGVLIEEFNKPIFLPSVNHTVKINMFIIKNPNNATLTFLKTTECPTMKLMTIKNTKEHEFTSSKTMGRNRFGTITQVEEHKSTYEIGVKYNFTSCIDTKKKTLHLIIEEENFELKEMKEFVLGKHL